MYNICNYYFQLRSPRYNAAAGIPRRGSLQLDMFESTRGRLATNMLYVSKMLPIIGSKSCDLCYKITYWILWILCCQRKLLKRYRGETFPKLCSMRTPSPHIQILFSFMVFKIQNLSFQSIIYSCKRPNDLDDAQWVKSPLVV